MTVFASRGIDEPMPIHRRAILKGGLAAIAAAGLPGVAPRAETTRPKRRVIPSSGEAIPVVGLGTWITFNVGTDPMLLDESVAVMAAFFEAGGTVIYSSPMYGSSQDTVGHGLAKLGYPPVFAADKVWTPAGGDGREQIGDSRRKWGVPRFDLMQVHNLVDWRRSTAVEPDGTQTMICGVAKLRRLCTLRMKCLIISSVTSKSAMTPSRNGRMA